MDKTLFIECRATEQGELVLDQKYLRTMLAARFAGKKLMARFQLLTPKRSLAANNYYWGCLVEAISDYTGYSKLETHELLKSMFATEPYFVANEKTGEIIEVKTTILTRFMDKARFAQFIDDCEMFAVSLGIQLTYEGDRYAYREDD